MDQIFSQFVFVEKAENLGVANLCCSANAVLGAEVLREACRGNLGGGLIDRNSVKQYIW